MLKSSNLQLAEYCIFNLKLEQLGYYDEYLI